jgi:hypothetical protein
MVSERYGTGSEGLGGAVPAPEPSKDERMLVMLGAGPCGAEDLGGWRKKGSSFQESSLWGGENGAGAAGGAGAGRGALLKNWVKLPSEGGAGAGRGGGAGVGEAGAGGRGVLLNSWVKLSAEAESEAPGEEKPLAREGPGDGGAGRGVSSMGREAGVCRGFEPGTKIWVKSPGPASAGAWGWG